MNFKWEVGNKDYMIDEEGRVRAVVEVNDLQARICMLTVYDGWRNEDNFTELYLLKETAKKRAENYFKQRYGQKLNIQ